MCIWFANKQHVQQTDVIHRRNQSTRCCEYSPESEFLHHPATQTIPEKHQDISILPPLTCWCVQSQASLYELKWDKGRLNEQNNGSHVSLNQHCVKVYVSTSIPSVQGAVLSERVVLILREYDSWRGTVLYEPPEPWTTCFCVLCKKTQPFSTKANWLQWSWTAAGWLRKSGAAPKSHIETFDPQC